MYHFFQLCKLNHITEANIFWGSHTATVFLKKDLFWGPVPAHFYIHTKWKDLPWTYEGWNLSLLCTRVWVTMLFFVVIFVPDFFFWCEARNEFLRHVCDEIVDLSHTFWEWIWCVFNVVEVLCLLAVRNVFSIHHFAHSRLRVSLNLCLIICWDWEQCYACYTVEHLFKDHNFFFNQKCFLNYFIIDGVWKKKELSLTHHAVHLSPAINMWLIFKNLKRDHVTLLLKEFLWLPVKYCIQCKLKTLAVHHFDDTLLPYPSSSLCTYQPLRSLCSSIERLLQIPKTNLKTFSRCFFGYIALPGTRCQLTWELLPPSEVSKLS